MAFELVCPKPAAIADIPDQDCPFRLDQIVRAAFGRRSPGRFTTEANFKLLATWTSLLAATDETKVVMTPIFSSLVIPSSEGLFTGGGDNTTFNGIREYNGENFVTVTGQFKGLSPAVYLALQTLSQYSVPGNIGGTDLGIIPINKNGYSFPGGDNGLDFIPVYNFRLGSRGSEGFNAQDIIPFSFDVTADWADHLASIKTTFDILTAI